MTAWIGLTGGIGSGKSQVAACFSLLDVPIIDADAIARTLTQTAGSPALQCIGEVFGKKMLDETGCLNRTAMRECVFNDVHARIKLENILHPMIYADIQKMQAACTNKIYGIIEIPTLTEHIIFQSLVSRILLVHSPEMVRIERVMKRNGLTEDAVRAIMRAQADDAQRLALADDVLDNAGSLHDLSQAVQTLHQQYLYQFS